MKHLTRTLAVLGLAFVAPALHAQHGHLNAGAVGQDQGDALFFANGTDFALASGYVKSLVYTNAGTYAGYYEGNISLTALPTTIANGGPTANAPAPGSFIRVQIDSVTGPAGGHFGFWEEGATVPTLSLEVGSPTAGAFWDLSDASIGAGTPGADPFGHLHGRHMTLDEPGEYTIGFRLVDTSANGAGGGPIHTPSEVLSIGFSTAVPEPSVIALAAVGLGAALVVRWRRRR